MWAVELCPPSDQALILDGAFGRKSNACNNYISVILGLSEPYQHEAYPFRVSGSNGVAPSTELETDLLIKLTGCCGLLSAALPPGQEQGPDFR